MENTWFFFCLVNNSYALIRDANFENNFPQGSETFFPNPKYTITTTAFELF